MAAYIHTLTRSVLHVGTRTWLFQRATKGHGLAVVGWAGGGAGGVAPLPETRVGLKHALWADTCQCAAKGV